MYPQVHVEMNDKGGHEFVVKKSKWHRTKYTLEEMKSIVDDVQLHLEWINKQRERRQGE